MYCRTTLFYLLLYFIFYTHYVHKYRFKNVRKKINTKLCHIEIKHDDKNIKYVVRISFTQGKNYFKH